MPARASGQEEDTPTKTPSKFKEPNSPRGGKVARLFLHVQPDVAVFGQKDYQQLAVIRKMAQDLSLPVQIMGHPTVRAEDGLALSSRNGYLSAEQRAIAPVLQQTLQQIASAVQSGRTDYAQVINEASLRLSEAGLRPDYLDLRNADNLAPASDDSTDLVVLAAAYLGTTRLIDNLEFSRA